MDPYGGVYLAPMFFNGANKDYITAVEELTALPGTTSMPALLEKLRSETEGDNSGAVQLRNAIDIAEGRIRYWQKKQSTGTSSTKRAHADDMLGRWQQDLQTTEKQNQQNAVEHELQIVDPAWKVTYHKWVKGKGDTFKYTHEDGRVVWDRPDPPLHEPVAPPSAEESAIASATTVLELLCIAGRECYAQKLASLTMDHVGDVTIPELKSMGVGAIECNNIIDVFRKYNQVALGRSEAQTHESESEDESEDEDIPPAQVDDPSDDSESDDPSDEDASEDDDLPHAQVHDSDEARYTAAVEDQRAGIEREHELDAARGVLSVRTCLGLAIAHRDDSLQWGNEIVQLYHNTVSDQGLDYTAESGQLVAVVRRTLGPDEAIEECKERPHCFKPEWKGELYLALLHKHRGGSLVGAARDALPYRVALGIAAMDDHLGMERTLGKAKWRAEEDLLQRVVADKRDEPEEPEEPRDVYTRMLKDGGDMAGPRGNLSRRSAEKCRSIALRLCIGQAKLAGEAEDDAWQKRISEELVALEADNSSRRGLDDGSGALPFAVTGRELTKLAAMMRPLPTMTQVPDAIGNIPFRTDKVVMTCVAKGECTLEAVRFATGSNRYTRATFGLPAKGKVNIKALVQGAEANPKVPFKFVKQRPTTWAGLLRLPWGIYVGRVTTGEYDHMIAYDSWRHMIFLGGDAGDPSAVCRGWFIDDEEVADPATFERFMMGMIDGLWKNIDGIYRVDVHAKKLIDTSYC
jgi:hypothetical protein